MLNTGILAHHGGRLWLGPEGEKRYGRANFRALCAAFESPRLLAGCADTVDIGQVESTFLQALQTPDSRPSCFTLGGRPWLVTHIDWERGVCTVRPSGDGNAPRLERRLPLAQLRPMPSHAPLADQRPRTSLLVRPRQTRDGHQRAEYHVLRDSESPVLESSNEVTRWNFAGGAGNVLLAQVLEDELGEKIVASNTRLSFREGAGTSGAAVRQALHALRAAGRPNEEDTLHFAETTKRAGRLSKFEACLPDGLLQRFFANALEHLGGARRALADIGAAGNGQRSEL